MEVIQELPQPTRAKFQEKFFLKFPKTRCFVNNPADDRKNCTVEEAMKICIDEGYSGFTYNNAAHGPGGRAWFIKEDTRTDDHWYWDGNPGEYSHKNYDHYTKG